MSYCSSTAKRSLKALTERRRQNNQRKNEKKRTIRERTKKKNNQRTQTSVAGGRGGKACSGREGVGGHDVHLVERPLVPRDQQLAPVLGRDFVLGSGPDLSQNGLHALVFGDVFLATQHKGA